MKKTLLTIAFAFLACFGFSQTEKNVPVFSSSDSLNVYGEWQSKKYEVTKGEEITIAYRFKVRKKFMMTCLYTMEVRNDGDKAFSVVFYAGNNGTNYYSGQIGVVREKVKLKPKETVEVDYRLPTKTNESSDTEPAVCKKCKENEHVFTFTR